MIRIRTKSTDNSVCFYPQHLETVEYFGATRQDRTGDLLITNLSYQANSMAPPLLSNASSSPMIHWKGAVSGDIGTEWARFPVPIFQQESALLGRRL